MRISTKLLKDCVVRSTYTLPPVPETTCSSQVLSRLENQPDEIAIIDGVTGSVTTRGQLAEQILRIGGWISGRISKGDTVGISLPNCPLYLAAALGAVHAGGVAALVNPIYTQSEVEHTVGIAKPKVMITSQISLEVLKTATSSSTIKEYVILGPDTPGCVPFKEVLGSEKQVEKPNFDFEDTALMPFSSGTTGLPKAICLSHKNCVTYNVMQCEPMFGWLGPGKNMLSLLPMFHMYGFTMSINCILKGAVFTTLPRFDLEKVLSAVQEYNITHLPVVPPIAAVLAKHPVVQQYNLDSLEEIMCAAAPLSVQLQNSLFERLKNVERIRNGYGMSELVAAAVVPPPEQSNAIMRKGGIGVAMPGCQIRVVDTQTGESLGPNKEGEIHIKADTVMKGYLGDAGSTAATVDADGWIHTGDIGKYDDENCFYITDRLKELIKYKGWQVAPAEIEDVLLTHPAVADVGVVGVQAPEDGDGEVPKAFVVLKGGLEQTEDVKNNIMNLAESKLSDYKRLRGGVTFMDQLPRSLAGKLLRKELRKL